MAAASGPILAGPLGLKRKKGTDVRYFALYSDRIEYFGSEADSLLPGAEPRGRLDFRDILDFEVKSSEIVFHLADQVVSVVSLQEHSAKRWCTELRRFVRLREGSEVPQSDPVAQTPADLDRLSATATQPIFWRGFLEVERRADSMQRYFALRQTEFQYFSGPDDLDTMQQPRGLLLLAEVQRCRSSGGRTLTFEMEGQKKLKVSSPSPEEHATLVASLRPLLEPRLGEAFIVRATARPSDIELMLPVEARAERQQQTNQQQEQTVTVVTTSTRVKSETATSVAGDGRSRSPMFGRERATTPEQTSPRPGRQQPPSAGGGNKAAPSKPKPADGSRSPGRERAQTSQSSSSTKQTAQPQERTRQRQPSQQLAPQDLLSLHTLVEADGSRSPKQPKEEEEEQSSPQSPQSPRPPGASLPLQNDEGDGFEWADESPGQTTDAPSAGSPASTTIDRTPTQRSKLQGKSQGQQQRRQVSAGGGAEAAGGATPSAAAARAKSPARQTAPPTAKPAGARQPSDKVHGGRAPKASGGTGAETAPNTPTTTPTSPEGSSSGRSTPAAAPAPPEEIETSAADAGGASDDDWQDFAIAGDVAAAPAPPPSRQPEQKEAEPRVQAVVRTKTSVKTTVTGARAGRGSAGGGAQPRAEAEPPKAAAAAAKSVRSSVTRTRSASASSTRISAGVASSQQPAKSAKVSEDATPLCEGHFVLADGRTGGKELVQCSLFKDRLVFTRQASSATAKPPPRPLLLKDVEDVEMIDDGFVLKVVVGSTSATLALAHGAVGGGAALGRWQEKLTEAIGAASGVASGAASAPAVAAKSGAKAQRGDELDRKLREVFDRCDVHKRGLVGRTEMFEACRGSALTADFCGLSPSQLVAGESALDEPLIRLFGDAFSFGKELTWDAFRAAYRRQDGEGKLLRQGLVSLVQGACSQEQYVVIFVDRLEHYSDRSSAQRRVGCRGRILAQDVRSVRQTTAGVELVSQQRTVELQIMGGDSKQAWLAALRVLAGELRPDEMLNQRIVAVPTLDLTGFGSGSGGAGGPSKGAWSATGPAVAGGMKRRSASAPGLRQTRKKDRSFVINTHAFAGQAGQALHGNDIVLTSTPRKREEARSCTGKVNERTSKLPVSTGEVADKVTGIERVITPRRGYAEVAQKITGEGGCGGGCASGRSTPRLRVGAQKSVVEKITAFSDGTVTPPKAARSTEPAVKITDVGRACCGAYGASCRGATNAVPCGKITDIGRSLPGWVSSTPSNSNERMRNLGEGVGGVRW